MDLLTYAEEEGVADQVDKAEIPMMSDEKLKRLFLDAELRSFYEDYRRYYATSNDFLRQVEKTFEAIADQPTTSKQKSSALRKQLPFDSRTIGESMPRSIIPAAVR